MKINVPYEFLEDCARKNACASLDMDKPARSTGQVIAWKHHHWVCVGSTSQYLKYLEADLRQVVPEEEYHGPPNDPEVCGFHYYTGGRLRSTGALKNQIWVMTDKEITIIPSLKKRGDQ